MQPKPLQQGDIIAIVCTAKSVKKDYIEKAKQLLTSWGLKVVLGKNLFKVHHQFAGTDTERANDLQEALDNPEVKAVLCARGGYGTVRIIDQIDFSSFEANPKWIIGYSDITVLHNHIHTHFGIDTLHATVPLDFPDDGSENQALQTLKQVLFDDQLAYDIPNHSLNRTGKSSGELIGGNLSILYSLTGTNSDIDTKGKILFIEDLCEYAYHVDRMIWNLKKANKLENLAGLIVGGFTDIKPGPIPFGQEAYEIILDAVKDYDYPICFDFPAGHMEDNRALIMGRNVNLEVSQTSKVTFHGRPQ